VSMGIRGPTIEAVRGAIKDIYHVVGVESANLRESRFQYAKDELKFNQRAVEYLLAGNVKNQGTPLALSPATLERVVSTFRFQPPPVVHHFLYVAGPNDKEKFDAIAPLLNMFKDKGFQAILFTTLERTLEMEKRAAMTKNIFPNVVPIFAHREQAKEVRMSNFDAFKQGAVTESGVKNRLVITSDDFAKYAYKVGIPYVNFVIQFCLRTKEFYTLQAMCAGRHNTPGISLTFATISDTDAVKDLEKSVTLHHLGTDPKFDANKELFAECVRKLVFDTVANPLTQSTDFPPDNWRASLEEEKKKEAERNHVRVEPPKRKPKGKRGDRKEKAAVAVAATAVAVAATAGATAAAPAV